MQRSVSESHIQTHRGLILLMAALWGVSSVPHLPPNPAGYAGGGSGHIHCLPAPSAALAALLCLVCINSKNVFQLNLFHPRWPSTWLVSPPLSQITSHSTLLSEATSPPPSWSQTWGETAAVQYCMENSSSIDRLSVFSLNIWCSVFPSKPSL